MKETTRRRDCIWLLTLFELHPFDILYVLRTNDQTNDQPTDRTNEYLVDKQINKLKKKKETDQTGRKRTKKKYLTNRNKTAIQMN